MPVAPNQKKKIERPPLPGFKANPKKTWDPPAKNTYTIEDLGKELSIISSSLLIIAATLAQPCDAEKLSETRDVLIGTTRHLESVYNRLMNHGVMSRQQDTMTVYRADDIPW